MVGLMKQQKHTSQTSSSKMLVKMRRKRKKKHISLTKLREASRLAFQINPVSAPAVTSPPPDYDSDSGVATDVPLQRDRHYRHYEQGRDDRDSDSDSVMDCADEFVYEPVGDVAIPFHNAQEVVMGGGEAAATVFTNAERITCLDSIKACFGSMGFLVYLRSMKGDCTESVQQITRHVAEFLYWLATEDNSTTVAVWDQAMVLTWLRASLTTKTDRILTYAHNHLEQERRLSPATVGGYLRSLMWVFKWITSSNVCQAWRVPRIHRDDIFDSIAPILSGLKRANRRSSSANISMDEMKRLRKVPPRGLEQLREAVQAKFDTALAMGDCWRDSTSYKEFMRIMSAAMYTDSVQGRVGGLNSLTLGHGNEIMRNKVTFTEKFKTNEVPCCAGLCCAVLSWILFFTRGVVCCDDLAFSFSCCRHLASSL